ncbi:unnamed protein product [Rhizophagus irregularis]|nr:unnamed protein product [Rhizophagus irregularis]
MGDDGSKRNKAAVFVEKIADHASTIIDVALSTGAAIGAAVEAGAPIVVPFTKFLPLISEIGNIFNEIVDLAQAAEHNKRTSKSIEKTFKELCKEFDSCVNVLSFAINVKTADEIGQLKADQDDLLKYLVGMEAGIKKIDVDVSHVKTDIKDLGGDAKEIKACLANLSKGFSSTVNCRDCSS